MKLSRGVNDLLRSKSVALQNAIKSNLLPITTRLFCEKLISKALCVKVADGIMGIGSAQLSAQVALAVGDTLAVYPERCLKYVTILEEFDSDLAREMEQKFRSELTCFEQELFGAMWHSHILKVNCVHAGPTNTFRATPLILSGILCIGKF